MDKTAKKKKFLKTVVFLFRLWIILSILLIVFLAPYKEIQNHRLFQYKMYHTILLSLQDAFLSGTLYAFIAIGILVSGGFIAQHFIKDLRTFFQVRTPKISRSFFLKTISRIAVVIALALNSVIVFNQLHREANVLIVIVDTLRSDYTAIGDETTTNTPYLKNKLMPESLYFRNAYSNSPWTLPSVASLLTSRYPSQINIDSLVSRLDDKHLTITEILKNRGYFTYGVISHLLLQQKFGLQQGFSIYNEDNISTEFSNHNSISSPGITNDAIQFIRRHKKKKEY